MVNIADADGNIVVYVSADPNKDLVIDEESATKIATLWYRKSWANFDEYAAMILTCRVLIVDATNPAAFRTVVCLCCDFQKQHVCVDCVAVATMLGKCVIPEEYKVLPYILMVSCFLYSFILLYFVHL